MLKFVLPDQFRTKEKGLTLRSCLGLNQVDNLNWAATVSVQQVTGSGPTLTSITNLRFNTDDTANPGTANPLVKPAAGTNYSYEKTVYLNADTSPSGTINNVKLYSDGSIGWTGCTLFVGSSGSYVQATGTPGTTGTQDTTIATANIQNYTSGSPKSLTGSITNPSTGRISDYVKMQTAVSTSAVAGTLPSETLTFQYDET
jgi:hypothetical protein